MKVPTPVRLDARYHDDVCRSLGNGVIAGWALIGLRGLERLEDPHVDLGIGPCPDAWNHVGDVAGRVIVGGGHPRRW